jgi:hypothetical protein
MLADLIFYFSRTVVLFLSFKFLSFLKISWIVGSFNANITFFTPAVPIIFNSSLIGLLFILFKSFSNSVFFKIPGLLHSVLYFWYQKHAIQVKVISIFIFLIMTILFVFVYSNTIMYALPWLICMLYVLCTLKKSYTFLEINFLLTWIAHSFGTLIYGIMTGFLTYEVYLILLPRVILERTLFVIIMYMYYNFIVMIDFILKKGVYFLFNNIDSLDQSRE